MYKQRVGTPANALLFGVYVFATGLIVFGIVDSLVRVYMMDAWWRCFGFILLLPLSMLIWRFSMTTAEYRYLGDELVIWCVNRYTANRVTIRFSNLYSVDGRKLNGVNTRPAVTYDCCATLRGRIFHQMTLIGELNSGTVVRVILEPDDALRTMVLEVTGLRHKSVSDKQQDT